MHINPVCSNRPRPSVHSNSTSHGNQYWARDVFHAKGSAGKTLCGVATSDWLVLDPMPRTVAVADQHFCRRCAAKLRN